MQTDAVIPTGLKTGRLGAGSPSAANASSAEAASGAQSAQEYLDRVEENVNKTIDAEVDTLLENFKELISLATIGDKDKFRIAQEAFQAQARADMMVRSAQSLSLLSESLKLSLLLSKSPDPSLDQEAIELMKSTELEKLKCAKSLERILGLDPSQAAQLVEEIDDPSKLLNEIKPEPSEAKPEDKGEASATEAPSGEDMAQDSTPAAGQPDQGDEDDEEDLEMEDVE